MNPGQLKKQSGMLKDAKALSAGMKSEQNKKISRLLPHLQWTESGKSLKAANITMQPEAALVMAKNTDPI